MNLTDFAEKVKYELDEKIKEEGLNVSTVIGTGYKNNSEVLEITIRTPGDQIAPCFWLDDIFKEYQRLIAFKSEDEVMKEAISSIWEGYKNSYEASEEYRKFIASLSDLATDYEKAKDKIVYQLVNADKNNKLLSGVPHRLIEDLAVIYRVETGKRDEKSQAIVSDAIMDAWNITEEDLYRQAEQNTKNFYPAEIMTFSDLTMVPFDLFPFYIVTNPEKRYGATTILFPNVLKNLADKYEDNLVILPSSVHEVIVGPEQMLKKSVLRSLIGSVNSKSVSDEEFLSDHPYLYVRETGKIIPIE